MEIDDALAEMADISKRTFSQRGLAGANELLRMTDAHFEQGGSQLSTDDTQAPFAPLFVLETLGYGWQVGLPDQPIADRRYEPQEGDALGTWLSPAEPGWVIPALSKT